MKVDFIHISCLDKCAKKEVVHSMLEEVDFMFDFIAC